MATETATTIEIYDDYGHPTTVDFAAALEQMDAGVLAGLRDDLIADGVPEQEFCNRYAAAHNAKFGRCFAANNNPKHRS